MKRTQIKKIPEPLPREIEQFIGSARIFDSSCSPEARVYFIDRDGGYYLKLANKGELWAEARMAKYFHSKGLGAEVLDYQSLGGRDLLLTARVAGEDCTHAQYLADPKRLCDLIATKLRELHETDASDCPVKNRMDGYIALAEKNYLSDSYDKSHFPDSFGYRSGEEAYAAFCAGKSTLKNEVLLHGDYCLPNIMLYDWRFSGFIDVGQGGIGDRHVDLFWGAWTLMFNLGTDAYRERFFDAYGRDKIDLEKLKTVAAAEVFG
ncbi:MAG: aminoglycoside 3'-phosphotransferase [Ruminococcaceae bacterium]|nr:aminoglycoside 3'-phosphotransferase [Oscillospiraceae bacterium]